MMPPLPPLPEPASGAQYDLHTMNRYDARTLRAWARAYGLAVAEAKDAEIAALRADLVAIAAIAHDGGLRGLSEHQALVSVRRLTLPHWDSTGCEKQHIVRLDAALAKEKP